MRDADADLKTAIDSFLDLLAKSCHSSCLRSIAQYLIRRCQRQWFR